MKASITNNSRALQGVHTVTGLVFIEPKATNTLDVADDYVERVKSLSFLHAEWDDTPAAKAAVKPKTAAPAKPAANAPSELSGLRTEYKAAFGKGPSPKWDADTIRAKLAEKSSSDDLKKQASELGIEFQDDITDDKLKELIDAKLAA